MATHGLRAPVLLLISTAIAAALVIYRPIHVVATESMAPAMRAGDVIIVGPPLDPIREGSIISYRIGDKLITHRVVSVEDDHLTTKGDNNQSVDPWFVHHHDVVGVALLRIPYLGHIIHFMQRPAGWVILIVMPSMLLISGELMRIAALSRSPKVETPGRILVRLTGWNVEQPEGNSRLD